MELIQLALMLPDIEYEALIESASRGYAGVWPGQRTFCQLANALTLMEDWPGALHAKLDRLIEKRPGKSRTGLKGWLGPNFTALTRRPHERASSDEMSGGAASGVLFTAIAEYFAGRPDLPVRVDALLSVRIRDGIHAKSIPDPGLTTLVEASDSFGWRPDRIRRLIQHVPGAVAHDDGGGSGAPMLLRRASLDQLRKVVDDSMSLTECRALLGTSEATCQQLIKSGLLSPAAGWVTTLDHGRNLGRVSRKGVADLLASLALKAEPFSDQDTSMRGAAITLARAGLCWTHLLESMLNGELAYHYDPTPCGRGLPYLFEAGEIRRLIGRLGNRRTGRGTSDKAHPKATRRL